MDICLLKEYEEMLGKGESDPQDSRLNVAVCQFFLGQYQEASENAGRVRRSSLQNRLLFHVAHRLGDEKQLMYHHQQLEDTLEDQLSLASIHYLRSHYQEAIDLYKRILLNNRTYLALNVYLALCYYKLEYYDVSLEVLQIYLQQYPDSVTALNLKACNNYKLYNGKAAEKELKTIQDSANGGAISYAADIVRHNQVVFRGGENALQVFPPLIDVLVEARLNLVIYYLKRDELDDAHELIKDLEPSSTQQYILKAIVHCLMGQRTGSREHLKVAQQYFQMIGGSPTECDTIHGRQCMASCYFLLKQFEEVQVYLSSIKSYFYNDDAFNFNYGQTLSAAGEFKEAEKCLQLIQNEKMKSDNVYISHLARCFVMNKKARFAWELFMKMETSAESFTLLQMIANDCYRMGQFYYSLKAFDVLEKMDPNPEYWDGKRGAAAGVFQLIVAGKEPPESLRDVLQILELSPHPQAQQMNQIIRKWAKDNKIYVA